ncbi:MAG: hypothetical protein ACOCSK_03025 [Rhodothermales bacterium]
MTDRVGAIRKHLEDMIAVQRHVHEAIERQHTDSTVRADAEANEIIIRLERILSKHSARTKEVASLYGVEESKVKSAVSSVLGFAAGMYDQVRDFELSRILRDDYVALSLVAMSYTSLHSFGLAVSEEPIANMASDHLKAITPALVALSKALPRVVVEETERELGLPTDASAASVSIENTQRAWEPEVTRSF